MYRNKEIKIRLTEKELERLDRSVAKTTMSREGYIRTLLRGYEPQTQPPERFWELLRELWDISDRLCVLADALPDSELPSLSRRHAEICSELQRLSNPQKEEVRKTAI